MTETQSAVLTFGLRAENPILLEPAPPTAPPPHREQVSPRNSKSKKNIKKLSHGIAGEV